MRALAKIDTGWLFLIAGIALLAATILVTGARDLARTRLARDQALVLRDLHAERLDRYREYLKAVREGDPVVVQTLAATQLRELPEDLTPIRGVAQPARSASVFAQLDPPARPAPRLTGSPSLLERLATAPHARLWMLGIGGVLLLVGLMPGASTRGG